MTVAAVILASTAASALADADGTPAVRRLADAAWAGGATPVVVCCPDPSGDVARALSNSEVTLVDPAAPLPGAVDPGAAGGPLAVGAGAATGLVGATEAVLAWPVASAWVDAETVTVLISAHGEERATVVQPAYAAQPGWPVLLPLPLLPGPVAALDRSAADLLGELQAAGIRVRIVETGDPGVVHDITTPRGDLPAFDGPPEPVDAHAHEWGAATADLPDDLPADVPGRPDAG